MRLTICSDAALKSASKTDYNEFRDHGSEDLRRLALFCWMHRCRTEPEEAWPIKFEELYYCTTLAFLRSRPEEKRAFVVGDVVGTYGPRTVLERAAETLRRPDMRGAMLSNFVNRLDLFLVDIPSFSPHLVESGLLQAIRTAFDREMPIEKDEEVKAHFMTNVVLFYVLVISFDIGATVLTLAPAVP